MNNSILIKLNFKKLSDFSSLIMDSKNTVVYNEKNNNRLVCAGKCDKNGWTVIFKAKDYKEAESIMRSDFINTYKLAINC